MPDRLQLDKLQRAVESSLSGSEPDSRKKSLGPILYIFAYGIHARISDSPLSLHVFLQKCESGLSADSQYTLESLDKIDKAIGPSPSVELIGEVYESLISDPGAKGSYYTPNYICDYIVDACLQPLVSEAGAGSISGLKIIDPAMGAGAFVLAAVDWLAGALSATVDRQEAVKLAAEMVEGADIDLAAVKACRLAVWIKTDCRADFSKISKNLCCRDSILEDWPSKYSAIIGNPPYLFGERVPESVRGQKARFSFARGQFDIYWLFYELVIDRYLERGGCHGFIVPDAILARDETACIREPLTRNWTLREIVRAGRVFGKASVSAVCIIWQKCKDRGERVRAAEFRLGKIVEHGSLDQELLARLPGCIWPIGASQQTLRLLIRLIEISTKLGDIADISRGEELGKRALLDSPTPDSAGVLCGADVNSLGKSVPSRHIERDRIKKPLTNYASPKIIMVKTGSRIVAAVDLESTITLQSIYNIHVRDYDPWYICGLLCSDIYSQIIACTCTDHKNIFPQINQSTVAAIPILLPDRLDSQTVAVTRQISQLAKSAFYDPENRHHYMEQLNELLQQALDRLLD